MPRQALERVVGERYENYGAGGQTVHLCPCPPRRSLVTRGTMGAMNPPILTITSDARAKIDGVRTFNEFPDAVLRVRVLGKEGRTFRYEIALEDPRERADDDVSVETDGLTVVVDRTAPPTWSVPGSSSTPP